MTRISFPLEGLTIGISISESPDMERLGYSDLHLQDSLTEFARYLLAAGATLAYGGDLRAGGFTYTLFDLVSTYKGAGGRKANRIKSYLGWPIHLFLNTAKKAEIITSAELIELPAPKIEGLDPTKPPVTGDITLPDGTIKKATPEEVARGYYAWCLSMTGMRERLAQDNEAQVLMGGRTVGYKGKYPGLVEEAYECMKAGIPVYLIGAFGGCTGEIIDAICGREPKSLNEKVQFENKAYQQTVEYYNAHVPTGGEPIDYARVKAFFKEKGIAGLNNHLSEEENERLFTSPHLPEIIALILKGMKKVKEKKN
ncbi:MAG: hypothetical protein H6581_00700 [Bacteroidia bacterium]|nr:hypothetical protein [Bacteroidia bacterium]